MIDLISKLFVKKKEQKKVEIETVSFIGSKKSRNREDKPEYFGKHGTSSNSGSFSNTKDPVDLAKDLDALKGYTEYLAENLNRSISYSEYLGENLNRIHYFDHPTKDSSSESVGIFTFPFISVSGEDILYLPFLRPVRRSRIDGNMIYEYIGKNPIEHMKILDNMGVAYNEVVSLV
jgi:hypothetical protein